MEDSAALDRIAGNDPQLDFQHENLRQSTSNRLIPTRLQRVRTRCRGQGREGYMLPMNMHTVYCIWVGCCSLGRWSERDQNQPSSLAARRTQVWRILNPGKHASPRLCTATIRPELFPWQRIRGSAVVLLGVGE